MHAVHFDSMVVARFMNEDVLSNDGWMNKMAKDIDDSHKGKHIIIKSLEKYASPLALIV